jgi:hypothetical protein
LSAAFGGQMLRPTLSLSAGQVLKVLTGAVLILAQMAFASADAGDAAFGAFKGLQGAWAIQSNGKSLTIEMIYDVGSKESIITEHFGKELSVFYRDGNNLLMTHFCNAGNQPRLRLKANSPVGRYEFEMFDITNLPSPSTAHVQRIIYTFADDKHLELEIVWKNAGTESSEKYTLTRIVSK